MRHKLAVLVAAAMLLAVQPIQAQGPGQGKGQGRGQGMGMSQGQGMSQQGSGQQMRMYGRSFDLLDQDKDGFISSQEYQQAFTLWDGNQDGRLDQTEWQSSHGPGAGFGQGQDAGAQGGRGQTGQGQMGQEQGGQAQPSPQAIRDEFKAMDRNRDGRVDFKEFQRRYPDMVRMEFRLIDADGSKWISPQEWESFRTAHAGALSEPSQ